jgi:tricorn protease
MQPSLPFAQPYFRTPQLAPDGRQIAFVHGGDIWLVAAAGGWAERVTANPSTHYSPRFAPDGSALAFCSSRTGAGDIYVLPLGGGPVRQLTFHDLPSDLECFAPDGSCLYLTSRREHQGVAVYQLPLSGGTPTRLFGDPYEAYEQVAVSPDGELLAFVSNAAAWWRRGPSPTLASSIWLGSSRVGSSDFRLLVGDGSRNAWPLWSPDGQGVYFVSDRDGVENLYFQGLDGPAQPVTQFRDGRLLWPAIDARGTTIVFERDFGIWRCHLPSGECEPVPIQVRADAKQHRTLVRVVQRELSELALAPDGKKIAFVVQGEIFADFADKELEREKRQGPAFRLTHTAAREAEVVWTPDSKELIYLSDRHGEPELYCYRFAQRAEQRLTESALPKSAPCVAPDGKWVAYIQGHDTLCLLERDSGQSRVLGKGNFAYSLRPGASNSALAWSPDSRWLAYIAQDEHFFSNVYLQHIDGGAPRQISFLSNLHADDICWAANGRFLIFTTGQYRAESQIARIDLVPTPPSFREEEWEKLFVEASKASEAAQVASPPKEDAPAAGAARPDEGKPATLELLMIVFEGIERRLQLLTPLQMDARALAISPDSRDLLFLATVAGKANLWTLPLDEHRRDQPMRQYSSGSGYKSQLSFTPDGKKLYFLEDGQIMVRRFPEGDGQLLPVSAELTVDLEQQQGQVFAEAWRLLRDNFYDPTFRGLDWLAVRERFAPYIAGARTRSELLTLLNLMCGELRASHTGVSGSGIRSADGYLGLLFDPSEQAQNGRLRVAEVVLDSPAALIAEPVRVGEYVLAVDGVSLTPTTNFDQLLQRSVGRRVVLRLGTTPLSDDAREVALRPVDAGEFELLRYRAWVHANEAYVHALSDQRLGYVHIRQMSYEAYLQFLTDLDVEAHGKQGIVIDVRFNRGGNIASFILDVLARRSTIKASLRGNGPLFHAHLAGNRLLNKPTILVVNEHSGSNAEIFAEDYRRLGLGQVVGRTTAGAVIRTTEVRLLDGSVLRLPFIRVADIDDADLEGSGRPADIDVDRALGEAATGIDSQLQAAVRALLAQLARPATPA